MIKKPIFDSNKLFSEVEDETKRKEEEKRFYLWLEWYSNFIDITTWLDNVIKEKREKSLFFYRLVELNKQLIWINKSVYSGAYYSAIRELRFIFESFIQAYYIDKEHPDSEMECKLEIIKEIEKLVGSRLIDKIDIGNKSKLKKLYSKLCQYIHPSYEGLRLPVKEGNIVESILFKYNQELFDNCYLLTNEVIDVIILLLMLYRGKIIEKIQIDNYMMEFLKKSNCELSLNLLNK